MWLLLRAIMVGVLHDVLARSAQAVGRLPCVKACWQEVHIQQRPLPVLLEIHIVLLSWQHSGICSDF
jgi:hypothetical protein